MNDVFLVGCGSGFSGDRLDGAEPVADTLIKRGQAAAMIFETLAERTLALGQLARDRDPDSGYEPKLYDLLKPVLGKCVYHNIPVIGNFGIANPHAAAQLIARLGRDLGLNRLRIGVVEGDDILDRLALDRWQVCEGDSRLDARLSRPLAANVYLGAAGIVEALQQGAQVVVTGRVADPALALAPLIHHFGWSMDDWDALAAGTLCGHLLECAAQVSGGYFADPGWKDVPALGRVGFPYAEFHRNGDMVISKADDSGGLVSTATVKEQLLYEIHDPGNYLTPDVILDINAVRLQQLGPDRVLVQGARGKPRPPTLKATLSTAGGWLGEAEISYAGVNAAARARLAAQILRQRMRTLLPDLPYRIDLIGLISVFDSDAGALQSELPAELQQLELQQQDVRVRLAASADEQALAEQASREVLNLYLNGPGGGGGVRHSVTPRIRTVSYLVPRAEVSSRVILYPGDDL